MSEQQIVRSFLFNQNRERFTVKGAIFLETVFLFLFGNTDVSKQSKWTRWWGGGGGGDKN